MKTRGQPRERERILYVRKRLLASIRATSATTSTLRLLQEALEEETGQKVGFNTLRRFFGLLPTGTPSFKTWSLFDTYLKSRRVLSRHDSEDFEAVWAPRHRLHALIARESPEACAAFLADQHGADHYPDLLGRVTNHFINAERRDVLEVIYTTDALFANHAQFAHYLSEIVGLTLRQLPPERVEALMPVFELPHFRATILYFFIDYDHLGGYYGQILRRLPPLDDPEALFHACILGYFDYLRGGDMPLLPLRTPAELRSYYPVLSGRYVGTLFLGASHSSGYLRRSYIRQLCLWHAPHLVCFEIVPALILIRDFETLHWLYDLHYEELYDQDNWATSQMTNLYLIGEAFLYLSEGNLKRARLISDSIQLDHTSLAYDRYVRLFHGVMTLELFAEDGASAEARAAVVDQLTTEVAATGFTRFLGLARFPELDS